MAKISIFPILILFGLFTSTAHAKIYKYVDEHGQVHYSSEKPTDKRYKDVQVKSEESATKRKKSSQSTKLKILPTKDLDKAVKEGRISQTIADRMEYFNSVSEEYELAKKQKREMRKAISKAKSKKSDMSPAEIKQLEKEYEIFVKEDFSYARRNYTTAKQKLQNLLNKDHHKKGHSSKSKKKEATITWN